MPTYLRLETTADGLHLHELPDGYTDGDLAQLRGRYDIPDDWAEHPDRGEPTTRLPGGGHTPPSGKGWDVSILEGPPHQSLLEIATVHEVGEL